MSIPSADRQAASISLHEVVTALDAELRTLDIPDFPGAMNGLQVANDGSVARVAVAVDASLAAVKEAVAREADLLIVHHGLFWSGAQPIVGVARQKYRALLDNNIAVYSTHLPLDAHPALGNNVQLAQALGLTPSSGFGRFKTLDIAVAGNTNIDSQEIVDRAVAFSGRYGGSVRTSVPVSGRRTRNWAIVTGGGASTDTLAEARARGIDTLIVGEGPHHTTVEALEHDLLIIYAGHYATETLGVQALGGWLKGRFGLPWSFLHLPTGS
ncbi:MAG TPA: Nif3-like dinuclear metal center hexameric protein [Casimicrobiaceae bacterium]|nr:Nif3-like dinuclear metal center hexameric protein [Casimicrobiaceae bacterium]